MKAYINYNNRRIVDTTGLDSVYVGNNGDALYVCIDETLSNGYPFVRGTMSNGRPFQVSMDVTNNISSETHDDVTYTCYKFTLSSDKGVLLTNGKTEFEIWIQNTTTSNSVVTETTRYCLGKFSCNVITTTYNDPTSNATIFGDVNGAIRNIMAYLNSLDASRIMQGIINREVNNLIAYGKTKIYSDDNSYVLETYTASENSDYKVAIKNLTDNKVVLAINNSGKVIIDENINLQNAISDINTLKGYFLNGVANNSINSINSTYATYDNEESSVPNSSKKKICDKYVKKDTAGNYYLMYSSATTKAYIESLFSEATTSLKGLMSAEDKTRLNTLYALLGAESDADNVVNTINEVLAIFSQYPEGADLVTALGLKADKSALASGSLVVKNATHSTTSDTASGYSVGGAIDTKFVSLDTTIERIQQAISLITSDVDIVDLHTDVASLKTRTSTLENDLSKANIEAVVSSTYYMQNEATSVSLTSIEGSVEKSSNLLVIADKESTTTNGVTYSIKNGVITLNGTATSNLNIYINISDISIGTYLINVFSNFTQSNMCSLIFRNGDSSVNASWTLGNDTRAKSVTTTDIANRILFYANNGVTFTNTTIKPMLVKGSTAPSVFSVGYNGFKYNVPSVLKVVGENLFDADKVQNGYYINYSNGVVKQSSNENSVSDYIEVIPNYDYFFGGNSIGQWCAFYDIDKNYISGLSNLYNNFTVPSNAYYFRTTITTADINNLMIYKGTSPTAYTPYTAHSITIPRVKYNLWDEEWEVGSIASASGENLTSTTQIRSTDYIRIEPNTDYYFIVGGGQMTGKFFDVDKNAIGTSWGINTSSNRAYTTPSNAYYFKFTMQPSYGTTYKNNIAIVKGTSGFYNPYNSNKLLSYKISDTCKNYVVGNKAYIYVGAVDLGSLNWSSDNYGYYVLAPSNCKKVLSNTDIANILVSNCDTKSASVVVNADKGSNYICITASGNIAVSSNTTPSGTLLYELATPIVIELDYYNTYLPTSKGDTIYLLDNNGSIVNAKANVEIVTSVKALAEYNKKQNAQQQQAIDMLVAQNLQLTSILCVALGVDCLADYGATDTADTLQESEVSSNE